jgi:pyruvate dehydrogenase E1 component alpha subunit
MATSTDRALPPAAPAQGAPPAIDHRQVREEIGKERLLKMYRQMLLIRQFEEQAEQAALAKKIAGFLHLYIGQEATATGFLDQLTIGTDYSLTSYRCHAQALLLGVGPNELMAELYGKATGNVRGKGGSMHFFSKEKGLLGGHGIVGGQIPVGTGAAFSAKYRKTGGVCVVFLGDGAVPQGTFHESLNMASLWSLPVVYVIENNRYGMGTACSRAVAVEQLAAAKAPGYGMPSLTFDGLDLLASWKTAQQALAIARSNRPVLVEAKTYRYRGHSASDNVQAYRSKEELAHYRSLDPLISTRKVLGEAGWLSDAAADELREGVVAEIKAALDFAEESPEPALSELVSQVYAPGRP